MNQLDILVAEIADNLNRSTDHVFKKRIESLAVALRATLYRREYERYGRFPIGSQVTIIVDTEQINKADQTPDPICNDGELCSRRTKIRIPRPIRSRLTTPFSYVGETDGKTSYAYSPLDSYYINTGNRFTKNKTLYDYINGHLYFMRGKPTKVMLKYVAEDMREIANLDECGDILCVDGNFIDIDMKDTIRKMIYEELNQNVQDNEVKVNE